MEKISVISLIGSSPKPRLRVDLQMTDDQLKAFRKIWSDQAATGLLYGAPGDVDGGLVPMRPAVEYRNEHLLRTKAAGDKVRDRFLCRALRFT